MKNEFQIEGYWWLPENPNNRIAGIFYYKPNEDSDLKLFGDFDSNQDFISKHFVSETEPPLIILGEDENANKITLTILGYGNKHYNFSSSFPLIHYRVRYCIKGVHLASKDDSIFNEIKVELESLTSWINFHPVRLSVPIKDNKPTPGFTLSYSQTEENLSFAINDGFELSVNALATYSDIHKEEIIVRQKHTASIKNTKTSNFLILLDKSYRLQSFLNMATFNHNDFLVLRLYSDQYFQELEDKKRFPTTIELFFKQISKGRIDPKSTKIREYLFTYSDVKDIFSELIKKWFTFDKKMMPILHHLIDSIEQKAVFKSIDFLIVVQALEGYHHRFFDKEPEKKKKLESRLSSLKEFFAKDILIIREIDTNCTANSRNYYSHFYNKSTDMQIAEGADLYHLTNKLRYLLICCFLHELGLENVKINNILQTYSERL